MKLYEKGDAVQVDHLVIVISGQPGACKTSLTATAEDPFTVAFDKKGIVRANPRPDFMIPDHFAEVREFLKTDRAQRAKTWSFDTGNKMLDSLTKQCIKEDSKLGSVSGGFRNQQGWGVLKTKFGAFEEELLASDKDIVFVCQEVEKSKAGGQAYTRPEMAGGSYSLLMADADLIGYIEIIDGKRILDFNPTEFHLGKNPCGWPAMQVPDFNKAPRFLADLIQKCKDHLSRVNAESAAAAQTVEKLVADIACLTEPDQFTAMLPAIEGQPKGVQAQVRAAFAAAIHKQGMKLDAATKQYQRKEATA